MGLLTPGEVMRAVESARESSGLSKAELARQSRVRPETVRRLLTSSEVNPTLGNVLDLLRPMRLGLELVEIPPEQRPTVHADLVVSWLSHYGAALYGSSTIDPHAVPAPEVALAEGVKLSRENASVARALPLAFWKTWRSLNMERLQREAKRRGQARALGFFLDLTAQLSGEPGFASEATKLHLRHPKTPTQFFRPTTRRERHLAELRTPEVARKWHFRMNMPLESFTSMFTKGTR